jgi:hypothetical protein
MSGENIIIKKSKQICEIILNLQLFLITAHFLNQSNQLNYIDYETENI